MRMRNACSPTEDELRHWAYDTTADIPMQDWELILSWRMERGLLARCVEYAADPGCPHAAFFLEVLYKWVEVVARYDRFEFLRSMYDDWLNVVHGVSDQRVKHWRHQARLVFQGVIPFEREKWWADWFEAHKEG